MARKVIIYNECDESLITFKNASVDAVTSHTIIYLVDGTEIRILNRWISFVMRGNHVTLGYDNGNYIMIYP